MGNLERIQLCSAVDMLVVDEFTKQKRSGRLWPAVLVLVLCVPPALAGEHLDLERNIGQIVVIDNERQTREQQDISSAPRSGIAKPGAAEPPWELDISNNVVILPQLGYDPALGFIIGAKFSDINVSAAQRI